MTESFNSWIKMNVDSLKTVGFAAGLAIGNYQAFDLINKIEALNLTMREVVTVQKTSAKERDKLDKRISKLEDFYIKILEKQSK